MNVEPAERPPGEPLVSPDDRAPAPPSDERHLIARLKARDARAAETLVREHTPRMLAVARRMMPREDDALDAVQDAFASAFRALEAFDSRSSLGTWLYRITINACLMKLRTRRRRPERSIEDLLPAFHDDGHRKNPAKSWKPFTGGGIQPSDGGPGDGLEREQLRDLIRAKIAELPESYSEVLLLRDIEGLDTMQTADVLGLSEPAVKTRLHRARQALRELLDPHLRDQPPSKP